MALQKYSGLPKNKVVGMAGILDSSRYKLFLSLELGVPVKQIEAMVMGGHGDTMVPLPRFTKVNGKNLQDLIKEGKISEDKVEKINNLLSLDKSKFRNDVKDKIRNEIRNGLEKENILNQEDKILLYKLYKKIQKEFADIENKQ